MSPQRRHGDPLPIKDSHPFSACSSSPVCAAVHTVFQLCQMWRGSMAILVPSTTRDVPLPNAKQMHCSVSILHACPENGLVRICFGVFSPFFRGSHEAAQAGAQSILSCLALREVLLQPAMQGITQSQARVQREAADSW